MKWTPLPPVYNDFRVYLREAWSVLGLPSPTPAQYRLAWFLQNSTNRRRGLRAFRGVGKSWISSAWVTYCLRQQPQYKFLVVSASKERADNFTTFTRQLIDQWDLLACLQPSSDQRDSRISFDVGPATPDHAPSVKSVGITGQLSGSRADEIIADDVEVSNNSETQNKRDKLLASINEFESILKPGGYITFLGTPQTEDSIYTKLQDKGYTELIFPARYPKLREVHAKYGSRLDSELMAKLNKHPELSGTPTDPQRFDHDDLVERELSIGRSTFALQFMLDTSLSDQLRYPLRLRDLIIADVDVDRAYEKYIHSNSKSELLRDNPSVGLRGDYFYEPMDILGKPQPYTGTVMAIDPSGMGKDETSYAVAKMLNGSLFIPTGGTGGLQGGYGPGVLEELVLIAKRLKVNTVLIESNFGDSMFTALIRPYFKKHHPVEIIDVRAVKQKELRIIDCLEPLMNQHRLVIDRTIIDDDKKVDKTIAEDKRLHYQLLYQMSRITRDKNSLRHDDRIDALASACQYWVDYMSRDADDAMEDREARDLDVLLKSFETGSTSVIHSMMGATTAQIEALNGSIHTKGIFNHGKRR